MDRLRRRQRRGGLGRKLGRKVCDMEVAGRHRARYATKVCPRCGARLYEDMNICYDCLYDFSRDGSSDGDDEEGERGRCEEALPEPPAVVRPLDAGEPLGPGDTQDLSIPPEALLRADEVGMLLRTPTVDLWVPVSPDAGCVIGRDPANDVVLHAPTVSRRHLGLVPTPDGMEVSDLGATNPATYRGEEVRGSVVVPYGDSVEVCGCVLTMTGPEPTLG